MQFLEIVECISINASSKHTDYISYGWHNCHLYTTKNPAWEGMYILLVCFAVLMFKARTLHMLGSSHLFWEGHLTTKVVCPFSALCPCTYCSDSVAKKKRACPFAKTYTYTS